MYVINAGWRRLLFQKLQITCFKCTQREQLGHCQQDEKLLYPCHSERPLEGVLSTRQMVLLKGLEKYKLF